MNFDVSPYYIAVRGNYLMSTRYKRLMLTKETLIRRLFARLQQDMSK